MPVGKYYCDYCEKQFQDTPVARKRHLHSSQHLRAKALWFHSFHSPIATATATADPQHQHYTLPIAKGVCNRFLKTGFCHYGDNCKYLHPNNDSVSHTPPAPAPGSTHTDPGGMSWGNLPPSLKPPPEPEAGCPPLPFVDWG